MKLDTLAVLWLLEHAIRALLNMVVPTAPVDYFYSSLNPDLTVCMITDQLSACVVGLLNGTTRLHDA